MKGSVDSCGRATGRKVRVCDRCSKKRSFFEPIEPVPVEVARLNVFEGNQCSLLRLDRDMPKLVPGKHCSYVGDTYVTAPDADNRARFNGLRSVFVQGPRARDRFVRLYGVNISFSMQSRDCLKITHWLALLFVV